MSIADKKSEVEQMMIEACKRSNRQIDDVNMIAVTKYASLETTKSVLDHHMLHIGESRWQDAKSKWEQLADRGTWHFIGHLQSNKAKDVVGKFDYIHSLDRISLADAIEKRAAQLDITVNCFVQVNVSGEAAKQGIAPEQCAEFCQSLLAYRHLNICGLMTMAPLDENTENSRDVFRGLRQLRDELNQKAIFNQPIHHLSMGMSNDFQVAIEEGATWVRIGTRLVGKEE
ncbi:YggS family pyridoxal phosphate-dependent enzyme [Longirhabdus pacifica]|uniref:YggS family pyridoxal phosphate-dependent enzyme n=1 Tax=Longirhabdus pacifica TaxID=2305227 RepID=UPI001008A7CE|nr:YggS family pyridoxal phosphate-dependent enzyme [Longirhabdus pacifica]